MGSDAVDAVLSRPTDQALKERVGGNAADLDWCLKLGCAAMSCRAPPVTLPVLCLEHSVGSGFLCRDNVLILSANPEKVVCRIGREATQIGCWGEQVPSEIVVEMVDKNCHSPLWWAAICH